MIHLPKTMQLLSPKLEENWTIAPAKYAIMREELWLNAILLWILLLNSGRYNETETVKRRHIPPSISKIP